MVSIRKRVWRNRGGKKRTAWQVDFVDGDGARKAKQFDTQAEARDWVRETNLTEIRKDQTPTMSEVCVQWLAKCEGENLERSTLRHYRYIVRLYVIPALGSAKINAIKQTDVTDARKAINDLKSVSLGNRFVRILKLIFNFADDCEYISRNPIRRLKSNLSKRHTKRPTIPQPGEIRKIRDVCATPWEGEVHPFDIATLRWPENREEVHRFAELRRLPMLETLWDTGIRSSEMRALLWSNVDLEGKKIHITQRADMWGEIGDCKTESALRTIEISDDLAHDLSHWRRVCPDFPSRLVFPTFEGGVLDYKAVSTDFARVQITAGLTEPALDKAGNAILDARGRAKRRKRYRLHHLRHFGASWRIAKRMNLKQLTTEMGHSTFQVTLDYYGHLIDGAYNR